MAEEEAVKASSTHPASTKLTSSSEKKATTNPASARKSNTPNASLSGSNPTKLRPPPPTSSKSQLASASAGASAQNAPKSQARPPPPTQKPPSLQVVSKTQIFPDVGIIFARVPLGSRFSLLVPFVVGFLRVGTLIHFILSCY